MAVLMLTLQKTQLGRALRAIAESPKAARLLGINVDGLFHADLVRRGRPGRHLRAC